MPLPILFIGIAAVTGVAGAGTTVKAGVDTHKAKEMNADSNQRIEKASSRLDYLRKQCGKSLENLGEEKMFVLEHSITQFLDSFTKLKNVDFETSVGLNELNNLHVDQVEFGEMKELANYVATFAGGTASGVAGGALTAFGAYGAATTFASASTGTAIASLSGAAASNATLAFFGGGSLATGGLGIAGGTAVLGGLVAGPALLIMGLITSSKAGKELENAKANVAEATEICEQLETGAMQCIAIRRRTNMFYSLLAHIDTYFLPLIFKMEEIIDTEGTDYATFSLESKKTIAAAASTAVTIKSILDTPILTEAGFVTDESESMVKNIVERLRRE